MLSFGSSFFQFYYFQHTHTYDCMPIQFIKFNFYAYALDA